MTGTQSLRVPRMAFIKAAAAFLLPGTKASAAPHRNHDGMPDLQFRRCTSPDCRRPYRISHFSGRAAKQSAGKLCCPHCGHVEALWEGDRFSLQPLTEEQEALFEMRHFADSFFSRTGSR